MSGSAKSAFIDVERGDDPWLPRAEAVHRQLRPQLPADYVGRISEVLAGGARICLAVEQEKVRGVALWRIVENTYEGRRFQVDDLVTDAAVRSSGIGRALIDHLEAMARVRGCDVFALDSGVQRGAAHKFYFREGLQIAAYSFRKSLS